MTVKIQIDIARYSKLISPKNTGHNEEKEEKLLERCPPGHEGTKVVDKPATIIDVSGTIITWYLPDALTETTQKEIRAATDLLGPSLEKSVKADGNWRYNQEWFKQGSENVGSTPGCINLSPAWFQQGHENLSDPEVSVTNWGGVTSDSEKTQTVCWEFLQCSKENKVKVQGTRSEYDQGFSLKDKSKRYPRE
ncbi:hypothetical protein BDR07DRAFT_1458762 [Suillus spraguei]|nr:hypothetical protein BDR07DRAFT_1458762 [Suillus spraguei]